MKSRRPHPRRRQRGFTLVETIMVLMILGIAAVGIASLNGSLFANAGSVKDMQVRSALMQECAEQVLAVRRFTEDGYQAVNTGFGTNACGGIAALTGQSIPSVAYTDPYTGSGCPTNGVCKLATISMTGMTPLTLLLVDY